MYQHLPDHLYIFPLFCLQVADDPALLTASADALAPDTSDSLSDASAPVSEASAPDTSHSLSDASAPDPSLFSIPDPSQVLQQKPELQQLAEKFNAKQVQHKIHNLH